MLQEYDAVVKAALVLRCWSGLKTMFLTLLHTNTIKYTQSSILTCKEQPPARTLAFSVCRNSRGSAFYFQLTKCLLFYIAGSKWRGVLSEMFSWVKALYSTSCSWELFSWRQTMASNIIVSIRCFLHQASFLFLVIIFKACNFYVSLCILYTYARKGIAQLLKYWFPYLIKRFYSVLVILSISQFTASDNRPMHRSQAFRCQPSQSKQLSPHTELIPYLSTWKWG